MKITFVFTLLFITSVSSVNIDINELIVSEYSSFIAKFNKHYTDVEHSVKFQTFKKNLEELLIAKEAHIATNGDKPFNKGITKFFDLTRDEFKQMYLNTKMIEFVNFYADCELNFDLEDAPDNQALDWRQDPVQQINPIKDQGQCGSCWAFSAVASLENAWARKTRSLIDLAEQQLVDCDSSNSGCGGGLMDSAIHYYVGHKSALTENYQYIARDGKCNKDAIKKGVDIGITGCVADHTADEDSVRLAVAKYGVLSVAIDANAFFDYNGGILRADGEWLNHGVAIVGYGVENETPYWIVRNSWGEDWGEKGYVRIYRGDNSLLINSYVLAPTLKGN